MFSKYKIREIPKSSADYPKEWRALSDAPETAYAVGDLSLLRQTKLVVVGSRRTPAPALKLGQTIAKDLSYSLVVTTGTADGGDGAAIDGALSGSGKVICVLAGGFSSVSQALQPLLEKVSEKGLILSPHPYETPVRSFSYEYRNKLLAALGVGTLVLGAAEKSGALITARYAWGQKKPVFALPYFPGSAAGEGCNAIIKAGGVLTETAFDIANKLGITLEEEKIVPVSLTTDELKVMTALRNLSEGHIMDIAAVSGLPTFKAKSVLSALEVKGVVVALGGNRYKPIKEGGKL